MLCCGMLCLSWIVMSCLVLCVVLSCFCLCVVVVVGDIHIDRNPLHLHQIISEVHQLLRHTALAKKIGRREYSRGRDWYEGTGTNTFTYNGTKSRTHRHGVTW